MSQAALANPVPKSYPLPCVIQIGFAGSRQLFDPLPETAELNEALHIQVLEQLIKILRSLKSELKLADHHFLCGISQIAIGADVIFTEACQQLAAEANGTEAKNALPIAQRIFLPQHLDAYLDACSPERKSDFDFEQKKKAQLLLASPHIVQKRMVSLAHGRRERFEECNREIVAASDVAICMLRVDAEGKRGGTHDFLKRAKQKRIPTIEIPVKREGTTAVIGRPRFEIPNGWRPPQLPAEVQGCVYKDTEESGALPSVSEFCDTVAAELGAQAERHSRRFSMGALVIIAAHILATLLAAVALALGKSLFPVVVVLLVAELIALVIGLRYHHWLHRASPSRRWALSRLLAELNRSVQSTKGLHFYPQYLFQLRLPQELRPLLRTLCVLHLRTSLPMTSGEPWKPHAQRYLDQRLTNNDYRSGQIAYYTRRREEARKWLVITTSMFTFFAWAAVVATLFKLVLKWMAHDQLLPDPSVTLGLWGVFAVVLPVLAVGAMSWAAAMSYEARKHTFNEMLQRLKQQRSTLETVIAEDANSSNDFLHHVEETEKMLLAETAEWYSLRRFTAVT